MPQASLGERSRNGSSSPGTASAAKVRPSDASASYAVYAPPPAAVVAVTLSSPARRWNTDCLTVQPITPARSSTAVERRIVPERVTR